MHGIKSRVTGSKWSSTDHKKRNFGAGVAEPASSHEHARDTMGKRARGRALYPWHLALSKNAVMAKLGDKTRERGELRNSRGFDPLWTVAPIVS